MSAPETSHRALTGRVVIATHNAGKLAEMRELLAPYGIEAVSAGELGPRRPDETGKSFKANARIKADAAAKFRGSSLLPMTPVCASMRLAAIRNLLGALGGTRQGFPLRDE